MTAKDQRPGVPVFASAEGSKVEIVELLNWRNPLNRLHLCYQVQRCHAEWRTWLPTSFQFHCRR